MHRMVRLLTVVAVLAVVMPAFATKAKCHGWKDKFAMSW